MSATVLAGLLIGAGGCRNGQGGRSLFATGSRPAGSQSNEPAKPAPVARSAQPVAAKIPAEENPFAITLAPDVPVLLPGMAVKAVQFEVLQVQAPLGEFSRSQRIWDHLDEQAVGMEMQMTLQRNGLRVGLGSMESRPPVHAILQTVSRRVVRNMPPSPPNSVSISLQLNNKPIDQTVFFFRPDRTLSGGSFPGATDVFRINWEFNSDNAEEVVVYITPEVRQDQRDTSLKATPLGVAYVPIYEGRIFKELLCRLVVSPGGYIVLGPSADVAHAGLLGREFLVTSIDGELYETILVIEPRVLDLTSPHAAETGKTAATGK